MPTGHVVRAMASVAKTMPCMGLAGHSGQVDVIMKVVTVAMAAFALAIRLDIILRPQSICLAVKK